jgi:hypothetical protein
VSKHSTTYTYATHTRGFWFTAPVSFTITGLRVPTDVGTGVQNVEVLKLSSAPDTSSYTSLAYHKGVAGTNWIYVKIPINKGDIIGILGARGTTTMNNSYMATSTYTTSISGQSVTLARLMLQSNLYSAKASGSVLTNTGSCGRVEVRYTP